MTRFDSTCIDLEFIVCGGYETYFEGNWDYVVLFFDIKNRNAKNKCFGSSTKGFVEILY